MHYELYMNSPVKNTILVTYFAFTSLSTVGFGDFAPRSNIERMVGAFMLLVGVMLFSTIMNGFIDILTEFKVYDSDINQGEDLARFFGVIKHFNQYRPIDQRLKNKIESHFEYQWRNDRNIAFKNSEDLLIFTQLPQET